MSFVGLLLFVQGIITLTYCTQYSKEGVSQWPNDIPDDVLYLVIKHGPIENIPGEEFERLNKLHNLKLWDLGIQTLPNITAAGDTLEKLFLIDNLKLVFVYPGILSSLTNLQYFTIRGSPLFTALPDAEGLKPTFVELSNTRLDRIPLLPNMGKEILVS